MNFGKNISRFFGDYFLGNDIKRFEQERMKFYEHSYQGETLQRKLRELKEN